MVAAQPTATEARYHASIKGKARQGKARHGKASQAKTSQAGAYPGFSEGAERRGGGPRSAKEANKPNKRATELKPRTCAHQGSMFRPYYSVCFVESSIFTALV